MKQTTTNQPSPPVETNPIAITGEGELMATSQAVNAFQEVQAAIILAKQFPRDYDTAWQNLMKACQRKTLAVAASYAYPRGNTTVSGPTVNLARVAAQCYGNMRFGLDILRDDGETMQIEGWAWDMEANNRVTAQDRFKKLVQRRKSGGGTHWIVPDERDLRELVNRRGAILVRNCLLQVMPRDLIEDAEAQAKKTLKEAIRDPAGEKKRLILKFAEYGVTAEMLNARVGYTEWTQDDIVDLLQVLKSLEDRQATRDELFSSDSTDGPKKSTLDPSKFKNGDPARHQSHADQANGNGGQSGTGPPTGKAELAELKESLRGVLEYMQKLLDDDKVPGSQHEAVRGVIVGGTAILDRDVSADALRKSLKVCQGWVEWIESQQPKGPPDDLPGPPADNENDLPSPPESSPGPSEESSPEATTNGDEDPGDQAAAERNARAERQAELLKLNRSALVAKANTTFGKVDMADESFNGEQFIIKACQTGILNHHVFGNRKNTEEHLAVFIIECEALLETTGGANGVPPRSKKAGI